MTWLQVGIASVVACVGASFTDWLFFGVLFHEKYKAFPEVWRQTPGTAEQEKVIPLAILIGFLTPVSFVLLCRALHLAEREAVILLGLGTWATVALPLLVTNHLFMKMHPLILVAHALGWLAKLAVCVAAVAWFLR